MSTPSNERALLKSRKLIERSYAHSFILVRVWVRVRVRVTFRAGEKFSSDAIVLEPIASNKVFSKKKFVRVESVLLLKDIHIQKERGCHRGK